MSRQQLSPENHARLSEYQLEGLIASDFEPRGEHSAEQRTSIESRAYCTWLIDHQHMLGSRSTEQCRSIFQNRHNPSWKIPELDPIVPLEELRKDVAGFARADSVLPRSDRVEDQGYLPIDFNHPDDDGDVPPPAEV